MKFPADFIDRAIGNRAAQVAQSISADVLCLYSNYAAPAFSARAQAAKILFQYHPGRSLVSASLQMDELAGEGAWETEPEVTSDHRNHMYSVETKLADRIICASSFAARGLLEDGVPEGRIAVIPYGVPRPVDPEMLPSRGRREMLFVGQGVQRKGLHLLAEAWRIAAPSGWTLRVVSSRMDPAIRTKFDGLDNVQLETSVSGARLEQLMLECDTLVLPSLVEGFGLVLGEALARGSRLIASTNTGLPDLNLPDSIASVVAPGSVDDLAAAITRMEAGFESENVGYRLETLKHAGELGWDRFRASVREVVAV